MKKLLYSIFIVLLVTIALHDFIHDSVKIFGKCWKTRLIANREKDRDRKVKEVDYSNSSALRPVNSWNGKMLIW
jgi:hypothetical protein